MLAVLLRLWLNELVKTFEHCKVFSICWDTREVSLELLVTIEFVWPRLNDNSCLTLMIRPIAWGRTDAEFECHWDHSPPTVMLERSGYIILSKLNTCDAPRPEVQEDVVREKYAACKNACWFAQCGNNNESTSHSALSIGELTSFVNNYDAFYRVFVTGFQVFGQ